MKYKVLLTGNSKKLINDFFVQMDLAFECMSSSLIFDDLKRHADYFKPDVFVFCMRTETRDDMITISSFHEMLKKLDIPYVAIGDNTAIDNINKIVNGEPDLALRLPISTNNIQENIQKFVITYRAEAAMRAETASQTSSDAPVDSTVDVLAKIDAEIEMMAKGISSKASSAFSAVPREPEQPWRPRILIIDDATIVHKTLKGHLDDEYEVATAINGKIALRFLQTKEVSLILLDYEMPDMNGPSVLKKLREDPYLAKIPVVFLTGINDMEKIKHALSLKPQGYLLKPINKELLLEKIHELVKKPMI